MTREEMDALVLDAMSVPPTEDWHYPLAPNQLGRLIERVQIEAVNRALLASRIAETEMALRSKP